MRPFLLAVLLLVPLAARAQTQAECPVPLDRYDAIDDLLAAAPSCRAAADLFFACATASSGDVSRGSAARERCERDFAPALPAPEAATYRRRIAACDRKYRRESGTMYRSFEAACGVEEAARRARAGKRRDDFAWVGRALAEKP